MRNSFICILLSAFCLFSHAVYAVECSGLTHWNAGTAYAGGDQVQHNGNAYRANWWSQNQNPEIHSGPWQVWTLLNACSANQPPVANANGPYSGVAGSPISFSSAGSHDPDGNIVSYQWIFNDGGSSTEANPSHTYTSPDEYLVTLIVTDDNGAVSTSSATASVRAPYCPPQYVAGTTYQWGEVVRNIGRLFRCEIPGWCSLDMPWAYEPGVGFHWEYVWTDLGYSICAQ